MISERDAQIWRGLPGADVRERDSRVRSQLGLLSEEDVAAVADVDVATVRNWRAQRSGPPFTKIGRRPLYRIASVLRWLEEREESTQP